MNPLMKRVVQAYRPLYLHGLLKDGYGRLPSADVSADSLPPASGPASRRRALLVALTSILSSHRSAS